MKDAQILVKNSQNLPQIIDEFLFEADVSQTTQNTYSKAVNKFLAWHMARTDESPTRRDILLFKKHLEEAEFSNLSISTYMTGLRRFFSHLASTYQTANIAENIKGAKRPRGHLKDSLSRQEVKRLLDFECKTITDYRDKAVLYLKICTGIRDIGIINANVGDITKRGDARVLVVKGKGASSKDEFLVLVDNVYSVLLDYFAQRGKIKSTDPLICSHSNRNRSGRISSRSLHRAVAKRLEDAGLKTERITPHSLRHTAASLAIQGMTEELGVPDALQVQRMMRHRNIQTTLTYIHDQDRLKNPAENFIKW